MIKGRPVQKQQLFYIGFRSPASGPKETAHVNSSIVGEKTTGTMSINSVGPTRLFEKVSEPTVIEIYAPNPPDLKPKNEPPSAHIGKGELGVWAKLVKKRNP